MNANRIASRAVSRALALAVAFAGCALTAAAPAHAEDGAWKIGQTYEIHFAHLDLDRPADRQALLKQVERAAHRLCERPETRQWRDRCEADAIASGLAQATPAVRMAVAAARIERNGVMDARN